MSDPVSTFGQIQKPFDRRKLLAALKDVLLAAAIGWAGAESAIVLIMAQLTEQDRHLVWYDDLMSTLKIGVGLTVGGLVYAAILHVRARSVKKEGA